MTDHTLCKVCGAPRDKKLGLYCRVCYNRAAYVRKHGTEEGYEPKITFTEGMPCPGCSIPLTSDNRYPNYTLCRTCGQKKATERVKEWRGSKPRPQRRPPNNPIIVKPKTHRAKGQEMPPPAPRIEVKPVPVDVSGRVIQRVPCAFGRFEGRDVLELKMREWGEPAST